MIYVVDAKPGDGKSSAAITMINEASEEKRFLYITPYLTEVERIQACCPEKQFVQPQEDDPCKSIDIKKQLRQRRNIVSTHALFQRFDAEVIRLVKDGGYTMIMDEVATVAEVEEITYWDLKHILKYFAHVDPETSLLIWDKTAYRGIFEDIKQAAERKSLWIYGAGSKHPAAVHIVSSGVFEAFEDVYLLTYMFNGQVQKYYFDFFHLPYSRKWVEKDGDCYRFSDKPVESPGIDYKSLIHICQHRKLNEIGHAKTALSKAWYTANQNTGKIDQMRRNLANFSRNICGAKSNQILWTIFKRYHNEVKGKGYSKGFIPCNIRATNQYRDRDCVAYPINRYLNPVVKNFFAQAGVIVDDDAYALSEMLQFIWRSAIRDGKPINVYVPSSRMRRLLEKWIAENSVS